MLVRKIFIVFSFAAFALAGCTAGRDFKQPPPETLQLGQTTYKKIFSEYGTPYSEGIQLVNGKSIKLVSYAFSKSDGKAAAKDVTPARAISFYFFDDRLVGHEFTSSFMTDLTDFDESKVEEIKIGETTRGGVTELFGRPDGYREHPLLKEPDHKGIVYLYTQSIQSGFAVKIYLKILVVTFDGNDVVADVEFSESGER